MLGGLGVCGRPFCCGSFMEDFAPVSTKMAKTQSMSLNPAKISGCCGRLMCCLRYEQPAYEELVKNVPKNGAFVETPDGYGNVTQVNVLRQTVKVKLDGPGDDSFRLYDADEVAAIPGGRPRDGSQPPHILVLKPKKPKEPEAEESSGWEMPERLIDAGEERPIRAEKPASSRRNRSRSRQGQPREEQDGGAKQPNRAQKSRPPRQGQGGAPKTGEHASGEKSGGQKNRHKNPRPNGGGKENATRPAQENGEVKTESKAKRTNHNRRRHKPKNPNGGSGAPKGENAG